jgi:transcriptional regulator with XRE-family HTH domain
MPTIKALREEARLSTFDLAVKSAVSISSINRMENSKRAVKKLTALKVLDALNRMLGTEYKIEDIEILLVD